MCNCEAAGEMADCPTCGSTEPLCAPCYGLKDHPLRHSLNITAESIISCADVIHHEIEVDIAAIQAKQKEMFEAEFDLDLDSSDDDSTSSPSPSPSPSPGSNTRCTESESESESSAGIYSASLRFT